MINNTKESKLISIVILKKTQFKLITIIIRIHIENFEMINNIKKYTD